MSEIGDNPSHIPLDNPGGSQVLNGLFPFRARSNSKRRRSSDNAQDISFDLFTALTESMRGISTEIEKQRLSKNNTKSYLPPISKGLNLLENRMSDVAKFCFSLANSHDKLIEENKSMLARIDKLENTISVNVASGDLVSDT